MLCTEHSLMEYTEVVPFYCTSARGHLFRHRKDIMKNYIEVFKNLLLKATAQSFILRTVCRKIT